MSCDCKEPCEVCHCDLTLDLASLSQKMPPSTLVNAKEGVKRLTPMRSIRHKCLDCCCGSFAEVKLCTVTRCALFPYRLGHRPVKG